jgi:phosphoribosyl-AMP cyclohydrolase
MPASPGSKDADIEEGSTFQPKFDENGLIAAIVTDAGDNQVLMFAYMNRGALAATISTGTVHFWSRSRDKLWQKGETSGETLHVVSISTDCDQDCLLIAAEQHGRGATCHTGRRSCFYRTLALDNAAIGADSLIFSDVERVFDPETVYGE